MSNPIIIWIASLIGWDVGPVVALATAVGLILYVILFMLLLEFLASMTSSFKNSDSAIVKLLLLIPIIIAGAVFVVLDIIHTIACFWLGYQVMQGLRSWWHKAV